MKKSLIFLSILALIVCFAAGVFAQTATKPAAQEKPKAHEMKKEEAKPAQEMPAEAKKEMKKEEAKPAMESAKPAEMKKAEGAMKASEKKEMKAKTKMKKHSEAKEMEKKGEKK